MMRDFDSEEVDKMAVTRRFTCYDCNETFEVPYGTGVSGRQMNCPKCGGRNVHRAEGDRGFERGARREATIMAGGGFGAGGGRGPSSLGRGRGGAGRGPRWA
jgi:hypothetical protein